jgi:DNA-directed RNA polymerase subunit RPC12/RpoP
MIAAQQSPAGMVEYRCRECGAWLLTSSATWGKTEVVCRSRRCGARNTIYFGGHRTERNPDLRDHTP